MTRTTGKPDHRQAGPQASRTTGKPESATHYVEQLGEALSRPLAGSFVFQAPACFIDGSHAPLPALKALGSRS